SCIAFFFQAEDGIRYRNVTGVQTCALPISDAIRPGAEHLLPTQVELDRDGEVSTQPVGWDGDLERPGLTTVVGRIGDGDEGLTLDRKSVVVPRRIEYVVSAGGESTSDYRALREHSRVTVTNSVPDQV